jgi:hypothetical protein
MPSYENPPAMTAMKVTREYIEWAQRITNDSSVVADDDSIFNEYLVCLGAQVLTLAPSLEEFLAVFHFVTEETPGEFAPIAYNS